MTSVYVSKIFFVSKCVKNIVNVYMDFFFFFGRDLNLKPKIYYVLFLPTEVSLR